MFQLTQEFFYAKFLPIDVSLLIMIAEPPV